MNSNFAETSLDTTPAEAVLPQPSETETLSVAEKMRRLTELEEVIQAGKEAFFRVGSALAEIRDRRLYKPEFETFEAYCVQKWGFKRAHARRLIEAAIVVREVAPIGAIAKESHAREIARVPRDQREAVLRHATQLASTAGRPLTAQHIAAAARAESPSTVTAPQKVASVLPQLRKLWLQATGKEHRSFLAWARRSKSQRKARTDSAKLPRKPGQSHSQKSVSPVGLQLGGAITPIKAWYEVPMLAAAWLLEQGHGLPDVPFIRPSKSGFPRSARLKQLSQGSWIDVRDDRDRLLRKARRLLSAAHQSDLTCIIRLPNKKEIRLNQPGTPNSQAKVPNLRRTSSATGS